MSEKAANTRLQILQKAFQLTYRRGYQATSVDLILSELQVTKGAFFYHFKSKDEMGLAMIKEVLYPGMYHSLIHPLVTGENAPEEIYQMMEGLLLGDQFFEIKYGCPAVNLIEEMSPVSADFKKELSRLTNQWRKALVSCLRQGQTNGSISKQVDAEAVSIFVMTGYSGVRNLGKIYGKTSYKLFLSGFKSYLDTLK